MFHILRICFIYYVTFAVGSSNTYILLQHDRNDFFRNVVEIVIDGWDNTRSVIRDTQQGDPVAYKMTHLLSPTEFRWFWISWSHGIIKVGTGETISQNEFMRWDGFYHSVNGMRVSYGFGSGGYYIFHKAECPHIPHCQTRQCCYYKDKFKCDLCEHDNVFYKRTLSDTKCERMCSFDENKCWPGTCSDELTSSCQCVPGFTNSSSGAKCILESTTKPEILTCQTIIYGSTANDIKGTKVGSKCADLNDFYGRFQPTMLKFDMISDLTINVPSADMTKYIHESNFGVTDTTVYIKIKPITGKENDLSTHTLMVDGGRSENVKSTVLNSDVNITLKQPMNQLEDGERLCVHYEAKGGGYVKGIDFISNTVLSAEPYNKTITTKVLCYRYDSSPPQHCLSTKTCNSTIDEPMQIQSRIIRQRMLHVDIEGWFDPIPVGGSFEHASGIDSYTLTVNEVNNGIVSTNKISETTMNASSKSLTLNMASSDGNPRLYSVKLEIKDIAGNIQQARRFVLYDESTEIKTGISQYFVVTSASADTDYQWQTHHNDVCLSWKDYFYNPFYQANSLLGQIKPDVNIHGIYEQVDGVLSVNGTPNVNGITSYAFSWAIDNGTLTKGIGVLNLQNQSYCHKFLLKDGKTYILTIKATDIVNNTSIDNRTIHIDRSPPHINNIGLVKNGIKRMFAHGSYDLAKMKISFEVFDPHSGILNVDWEFGSNEVYDILGSGFITARTSDDVDHCPANSTDCYCPDVGPCEIFKYRISFNKLMENNTNLGKHNRNYYFKLKATNNANLVTREHLNIIMDHSPPDQVVVFEALTNQTMLVVILSSSAGFLLIITVIIICCCVYHRRKDVKTENSGMDHNKSTKQSEMADANLDEVENKNDVYSNLYSTIPDELTDYSTDIAIEDGTIYYTVNDSRIETVNRVKDDASGNLSANTNNINDTMRDNGKSALQSLHDSYLTPIVDLSDGYKTSPVSRKAFDNLTKVNIPTDPDLTLRDSYLIPINVTDHSRYMTPK